MRMRLVGAVALAAILLTGITSPAKADDVDAVFIGAVSQGLHTQVDEQTVAQLIADGHKACTLMDAGQNNDARKYIQNKYQADPSWPFHTFMRAAASAYCPWHSQELAGI